LLEHGLVDQIVARHDLRDRLINLIGHLASNVKSIEPAALLSNTKKPVAKKKAAPRKTAVKKSSSAKKSK
jgi:enoyl-CoA hydratase/carnithine racemase